MLTITRKYAIINYKELMLFLLMVIDSQLAPCQQSYRITLDLTVDQDFNPRQIDFRRVFNLSDYESINTHIEEF